MTEQTSETKVGKLHELYARITRIAEEMRGTASRFALGRSLPDAMVASPRSEEVPALHVEMPGGFKVDFAPSRPLTVGNALAVQAVRILRGARMTDWFLSFGPNGWQKSGTLLSDIGREAMPIGGAVLVYYDC